MSSNEYCPAHLGDSSKLRRPFEYYFDVIDTEVKAYWLGFILADGCVMWHERDGNYALSVALQQRDAGHLIQLERDMGGNRVPVP